MLHQLGRTPLLRPAACKTLYLQGKILLLVCTALRLFVCRTAASLFWLLVVVINEAGLVSSVITSGGIWCITCLHVEQLTFSIVISAKI